MLWDRLIFRGTALQPPHERLQRAPQRDRLAHLVVARDEDVAQAREGRRQERAVAHPGIAWNPAHELQEVAEVAPHQLGPEHPVVRGALAQRRFEMPTVVVAAPLRAALELAIELRVRRHQAQDLGAAQPPEVLARATREPGLLELLEVLVRSSCDAGARQPLA